MAAIEIDPDKLQTATATLYALILADDDLMPFFEGLDVAQIEHRQFQFLKIALTTEQHSPTDLRRVHAPLLARGRSPRDALDLAGPGSQPRREAPPAGLSRGSLRAL